MKIGIITWFNTQNYGTNLQAIALQQYLKNDGHDVEILNFQITSSEDNRTFFQKVVYQPQKYANRFAYKKYRKNIAIRNSSFENIIQKTCTLTEKINSVQEYINTCNKFELLICGSDQIWNPNWYHEFYYADFPEIVARKISYAPSIGVNRISEDLQKKIKNSLKSFSAISIREEQGRSVLTSLSPMPPEVVVDPTLLLSSSDWECFSSNKNIVDGDYVLSMFLSDNRRHWKAAKRFANDRGLTHIIVPYCGFSYFQHGIIYSSAGIEELLNLIKRAKYVLTDSFHITVFSLIFNRQFYTFQRFKENNCASQNSRIKNLLKIAHADKRLIAYNISRINEIKDIDYNQVNNYMQKEIQKSKQFLINAIRGDKYGV